MTARWRQSGGQPSVSQNMIGAFHQPIMVVYDVNTLMSLPPREVSSGLAEMVKHGLILDRDFAYWCRENGQSAEPGS